MTVNRLEKLILLFITPNHFHRKAKQISSYIINVHKLVISSKMGQAPIVHISHQTPIDHISRQAHCFLVITTGR